MCKKHILVLGAGSVGKRHLRNLAGLGCTVAAMDPRPERLEEAAREVTLQQRFTDLSHALAHIKQYQGVVVASPPKFHVEQCLAVLEHHCPVLLEKPVAPTLAQAQQLHQALQADSQARLLLGYTYRWWPPLHTFAQALKQGKIGKPLHAKFVMSAHLADWHPWERYQDFFMASRDLGGGALLDESHFLDLMLWFFGMPAKIFAQVEKISDLEIDTDDNVDILASYPNGLRVSIHLDLYGRPHEKYISVTGDQGTLHWSFDPNCVRTSCVMEQQWETQEFDYARNDMFVKVAEEFLQMIDGATQISCTVQDGVQVMALVEACRQSTREGKIVVPAEFCS